MTVSARYLMTQLETLEAFGLPVTQCLYIMDVAPSIVSDPRARIDIDRVLTLLNTAEKQLNDPLIGLRVGYKFRINAFAQTGNIYSYCRDLDDVISANARFQCLAIDAGSVNYMRKTHQGQLRHFMTFKPHFSDMERYRHIVDLVMGAYGTAYRWLSWASGEDLKGACLPYQMPEDTAFYRDVFDCPLTFDGEDPYIELADAAMRTPLATADPEKHARVTAQLEVLLGAEQDSASLRRAVETAVAASMANGSVNFDCVADRLNKKPAVLRTELKAANIGYRELVNQVRKDAFVEHFDRGDSFAAIAQNLAYNDQAAFNRAFKGWYGQSPTLWAKGRQSA